MASNSAWRRFVWLMALIGICFTCLLPGRTAQAYPPQQAADPQQRARSMLSRMTPEEKVGQLFLVTFRGRDVTSKEAKILDLIANRHVGGVILRAANDNFTGPQGTVEETYRITSELQSARWSASQKQIRNSFGYIYTPQYIPLWIGIAQEGDLYPYDQIFSGLTALPGAMALGATWKTTEAERAGKVLGEELQALGLNLFLGPSLDLAESQHPEGTEYLSTRVFGGNSFWVGEMGKAFIRGLHQGSSRKLAVIARSFPGIGAADRSPEEEVASVLKTQEQLKQSDLLPFFAVTGNAGSIEATADGLLVANIRYQGWQGAVRSTTRPLSFDTAALDQVLALPEVSRWRQGGGVLVSDNLGSQAIKKFYESTGQDFDARQITRSAFLGGSDLLYVDNLISTGDADSYATILKVLDFFVQKYREDTAFAQRVDLSVQRVLALKYRLFGEFALINVTPLASELTTLGQSTQITFDLARQALTLIHPTQSELSKVLPGPPEVRERMFFLTDVVSYRQCSQCAIQPAMAVDALQNAAVRLYGPRAGGQINAANLSSYSFLDLKYYLDENKEKTPPGLEDNLKLADWVVVALIGINPARPEAQAFKQLLARRPDLLRNKKVVVFAFGTPYSLDATDLSKINAYYALYSKVPAFIEVAVRALFQELNPTGGLPVSVLGAGYDLQVALSPDPNQVIALEVDMPSPTPTPATVTATPRPGITPSATQTSAVVPTVKVGDLLPLRTGVILDHNRNVVPDGTVVQFIFTSAGSEGGVVQQITATTVAGVARASYRIQSSGSLDVRVVSEPAQTSKQLRVNISPTGGVAITAVTPTPLPPTPTITPTVTPTPTSTPTATATPTPPPPPKPGAGNWLISLLIAWGVGGVCFWLGYLTGSLRWGVRWGLLAAGGGLLVYTYLAAGLPGGPGLLENSGLDSLAWLTLIGAVVGGSLGFVWKLLGKQKKA